MEYEVLKKTEVKDPKYIADRIGVALTELKPNETIRVDANGDVMKVKTAIEESIRRMRSAGIRTGKFAFINGKDALYVEKVNGHTTRKRRATRRRVSKRRDHSELTKRIFKASTVTGMTKIRVGRRTFGRGPAVDTRVQSYAQNLRRRDGLNVKTTTTGRKIVFVVKGKTQA